MQLRLDPDKLDDAAISAIKDKIQRSGLYVSSMACDGNHIDPDPAKREQQNKFAAKCIELAGKLGIPNIGGQSGTIKGRPLQEQVDEIVRVYNEKYFALCQKNNVRILWEPYAGGPNIATGPVGWEALFKAFNNNPHVGLQFDPSHLVWQFMDPVQAARDFADKIYDVHLKDTEILWHVLRRGGIQPVNNARWWRFRLPGQRVGGLEGLLLGAGGCRLHRRDEHRERRRILLSGVQPGKFHGAVQARLPHGA